jgi:ketosteroid isomerase-like protein
MVALLDPVRSVQLPFTDPRYEMIDPKVQRYGDVALLTFNLVNYGKMPGQPETVLSRWNSTQVYRRIEGEWRIVHSHWSFTKPETAPAAP